MKFYVPDMSCGHCTFAITKEVTALDPQASLITDLESRTVEVVSTQTDAAIVQAIKAAEYDAVPNG